MDSETAVRVFDILVDVCGLEWVAEFMTAQAGAVKMYL
jgi:hypothetical protein